MSKAGPAHNRQRRPAGGRGAQGEPPGGRGAPPLLTLLLGRAGAGKTWACLDEALQALAGGGPDGPPLVLLAPEQATHQLERALLARLPAGAAVARLEVLSFRRMAHRVLEEAGGLAAPRLGEAGRRMVLGALLQDLRAELRVFGASADRPGLARALAQQLAEFQAYALTPQELRSRAGELAAQPGGAARTAERLSDLALLWEAYTERLRGLGLADPGSDLAAAAQALPRTPLAGARVWVDGFAGFTPCEEHLLRALLQAGADVTAALCLDGREPAEGGAGDPGHPFAPTRRTLRRLLRLAPGAAVRVLEPPGGLPRFRACPDLGRLEAGLWAGAPTAEPAAPGARFLVAADPAAEAAAAADEIDRLVRAEGYRYREVAVIVRDMASYADLVGAACAARGIPVFADLRRPAGRHPVFALLAAALGAVAEGWSLPAMRRYLHCDLCGLSRAEADALENVVLAHGLSGPAWHGPREWSFPPPAVPDEPESEAARAARAAREARLDRLRRRLAGPLQGLERALRDGPSGEGAARACWHLLEEVGAPETVGRWIAGAEDPGEPAWHRGCWDAAMGLLDQLALALAGRALPAGEALAAWRAGAEGLSVGLVPPRLDQVLCGAVERSRQPELRAAFVLGVADGAFPAAAGEAPLLGDGDRLALRLAGCELAPTAAERLLSERYLGYIALTRASERLYLSCPAGAGPSELFRCAQQAVGHAAPWPAVPEPSARRGLPALAVQAALHPEWGALRGWLASAAPDLAGRVFRGRTAPPPLPAELAARLYPARTSASRLETAAACAYQHFARYGLRLRRREEAAVDAGHVGQLLHAALAVFVRGLREDGRDPGEVGAEEAGLRAAAALAAAQEHVLARLPRGTARGPFLVRAAERDLRAGVEAILAHARAGAYRAEAVEADLEHDGVALRVDRLDAALGADGRRRLRIVDYKTGADRFVLADFVHGLQLAPVLYLAAALAEGGAPLSGGFFILPVRDRMEAAAGPDGAPPPTARLAGLAPAEPEEARLHEAALDGAVTGVRWKADGTPYARSPVASAEQFQLLLRASARRVRRLQEASAAVAADPYRRDRAAACDRCEFLAVCGFDPSAGDRYRWLRPVPEPWLALAAEEADRG